MTSKPRQEIIQQSIGQAVARLYFKGATDGEVLRHCQRMQRRYLDAAAAITLEVKLSGDDAPLGHATARRSNILSAMMWRSEARRVQQAMARSAAQQRLHDILKPMAQYVINSGFEVRYDTTGGETVVLIEGEEECFHLEFDDRDAFIRQVNAYEAELGMHDGDDVIAELAAAKPYVESLA